MTTIQSKYFIFIFTYIVEQNYFQFSSRVYSRLNEVWNLIYTNILFQYAYVKTMHEVPWTLNLETNFARSAETTYRANGKKLIDQGLNNWG